MPTLEVIRYNNKNYVTDDDLYEALEKFSDLLAGLNSAMRNHFTALTRF